MLERCERGETVVGGGVVGILMTFVNLNQQLVCSKSNDSQPQSRLKIAMRLRKQHGFPSGNVRRVLREDSGALS